MIVRCGEVEARPVVRSIVRSQDCLGPVAAARGLCQAVFIGGVDRAVISSPVELVSGCKPDPGVRLIAEGCRDAVAVVVPVIPEAVGEGVAVPVKIVFLELDDAVLPYRGANAVPVKGRSVA